jgi:hypothetical protein
MHPFLDVSKLSDEVILERLGRAYTYMNHQTMMGHNPTVQSIKEVIQSLEDERVQRLEKIRTAELEKKNPKANQPLELGKLEGNTGKTL